MTPELKQQWLNALRSGEYEKGVGFLRSEVKGVDRWCCLGVLCDIVAPEMWVKIPFASTYYMHSTEGSHFLSDHVREVAFPNVETDTAYGRHTKIETQLAMLNDASDSFEAVTRFIEEHVEVETPSEVDELVLV